jgi:tRNA(Ile)-lysidine synthase
MKTGSQLISDYLTDRKISVFEKRRQLVITNADGRIIWLVGQRPDERFRIDENTQDTLSISMEYET